MPTGQSGGLSHARFHDGGDGNGNALVTSRDYERNARQGFRGSGSHNRGGIHGDRVLLHVRNGLRSSRFLHVPVRGVPHICTCFFLLFP